MRPPSAKTSCVRPTSAEDRSRRPARSKSQGSRSASPAGPPSTGLYEPQPGKSTRRERSGNPGLGRPRDHRRPQKMAGTRRALGRVTAASRSAKPGFSSLLPIREAIELHRLVVVMLDQGKTAPPVVVAPHSPQRFADRGHATEDVVA